MNGRGAGLQYVHVYGSGVVFAEAEGVGGGQVQEVEAGGRSDGLEEHGSQGGNVHVEGGEAHLYVVV